MLLADSLVSPEIREQVAQVQARTKNPAAFQPLDDLKVLRPELGLLAEQAVQWLRGLGANPQDPSAVVSTPTPVA